MNIYRNDRRTTFEVVGALYPCPLRCPVDNIVDGNVEAVADIQK